MLNASRSFSKNCDMGHHFLHFFGWTENRESPFFLLRECFFPIKHFSCRNLSNSIFSYPESAETFPLFTVVLVCLPRHLCQSFYGLRLLLPQHKKKMKITTKLRYSNLASYYLSRLFFVLSLREILFPKPVGS